MSTPFLIGFTSTVVTHLLAAGLVEIAPDREDHVVAFVADHLAGLRTGHSLISSLVAGLLACPDVEELYADDESLKELITELGLR